MDEAPMGQQHYTARVSRGIGMPGSAIWEGLGHDYHCHFGMDDKLLPGFIVLIYYYIYTLLINTSNMIYIFDINGGN
jgi:hypothetical protein